MSASSSVAVPVPVPVTASKKPSFTPRTATCPTTGTTYNATVGLLVVEASLASCGAVVLSNPFEVVKTRMQLQGELQKAKDSTVVYRGPLQGVYTMCRHEGFLSLFKGLNGAFVYQTAMNGTRIGLYEPVKGVAEAFLPSGFVANLAAASACGVIGALVGSPFFLVKTRLQSFNAAATQSSTTAQATPSATVATTASGARIADGRTAVGSQYQYRGTWDGLVKIFRSEGVTGLWRGGQTSAVRTMVGSAAQLTSYDFFRSRMTHWSGFEAEDIRLHLLCATLTSFFVTFCMNPFDVVMTRAFNSSKKTAAGAVTGAAPGVFSSLGQIVKIEGVRGLYKGSTALVLRTLPHSIGTFLILEQLRAARPNFTLQMAPWLFSQEV